MNSTFAIAQTAFRIRSALDMYYPEEAGPMVAFSGPTPFSSDINIATEILQHSNADFKNMKVVAEAESAWKLLDDGECRWFVSCFEMPNDRPPWAAKMNAGCNNIIIECNFSDDECRGRVPSPLLYPLDQLLLTHVLASRSGCLVHGAGIMRGEEAVVLLGVSGAGKTTISDIINEHSDFEILSDDRIVIREQEGCFRAHGTPWPGDGGYALNKSGVLKGIYFLRQGEGNELRPLEVKDVFERIMPVASIPWYDEGKMNSVVSFVESLVGQVSGYDFVFKKDESVIKQIESLFE